MRGKGKKKPQKRRGKHSQNRDWRGGRLKTPQNQRGDPNNGEGATKTPPERSSAAPLEQNPARPRSLRGLPVLPPPTPPGRSDPGSPPQASKPPHGGGGGSRPRPQRFGPGSALPLPVPSGARCCLSAGAALRRCPVPAGPSGPPLPGTSGPSRRGPERTNSGSAKPSRRGRG